MPLLQHEPSSIHDDEDQQWRVGCVCLDAALLFPAILDRASDEGRAPVLLPMPSTAELASQSFALLPHVKIYSNADSLPQIKIYSKR